MRNLIEIRTRGDACTLPGGIVLRERLDHSGPRFVVHDFAETDANGQVVRGHTNGGYHPNLSDALEDMTRRVRRAERFDTGGSLELEPIRPLAA